MKIWLFLKATFGFMGAYGILLAGLGISVILALYFVGKVCYNYYTEEI